MSNRITAYFRGRVGVTEAVYQNDYGIVMNFDDIDLPAHFDCYFSTPGEDEAVPAIGADNMVQIPNAILARSGRAELHIPIHSGANDSEVEYIVHFKVIGRARPVDDGTPVQMTAIEQALALLQNPIGNIEQIVNEALAFTGDTFQEMQAQLDADQAAFKTEVRGDIADVESDFDNLNAQFQTAVSAVTVDSEVQNVRVGADNVTYASAGEAVRTQFTNLKSELTPLYSRNITAEQGYWAIVDGSPTASSTWGRSKGYIPSGYIYKTQLIMIYLQAFEQSGAYVGTWDGSAFTRSYTPAGYVQYVDIDKWMQKYPSYKFKFTFYRNGAEISPSDIYSDMVITAKSDEILYSLNHDIKEIGKNYFNGEKFADDSYYSFANGIVSVLRDDSRAESLLEFRMPLVAGQKYVISVDHQTANFRYQIYDDVSRTMAYNSVLPNLYETFAPAQSGKYTLKIITEASYPQYVDNLFIGEYENWIKRIKSGFVPNFDQVSGNAEAINRAIAKASVSPFKTVRVPSGSYTLEKSIVVKKNVTLLSEVGAEYTLANNVDAPMIINGARTIYSSSITDEHITIDGGSWDGNRANQQKTGEDGLVVGFWFTGVSYLTIKNCYITNTRTYGILLNNVSDVLAENLVISVGDVNNADNGDGFHVIGPANNIALINSKIKSEDNAIAFNANDVDHGIYTTSGDIVGVTVENIQINNADGGQGILLLSSHAIIKDIYINNVTGEAPYLLQMNSWNIVDGEEGSYENIVVKNVSMKWRKSTWNCFIYGASGGTFNNITLENIKVDDWTPSPRSVDALIAFYKSFTNTPVVNNLIIKDVTCYRAGTASGNWTLVLFENVEVLYAVISGLNDRALRGKCTPIKVTNSTIYHLILSDFYINSVAENGWINLYNSFISVLKMHDVIPSVIQLNGITSSGNSSIGDLDVNNYGTYFYGLDIAENHSQFMTSVNVSAFPNPSVYDYFSKGQIVVNRSDSKMYLCTSSGITASRDWQANRAYGYLEKVTHENELYVCITAGTSGEAFSPTDGDFTDGTCKWRHLYGGQATFTQL